MLRPDDFLRGQFVLEGWRQGLEYGGHLAAVMVISCLMNRVRFGWGTHLQVLQNIPNLSAVNEQPNRNIWPQIWEPNFVRLLHEIDGQFEGSIKDLSNGAIYWADLRRIERPWFSEKVIHNPDYTRVADMNSLVFWGIRKERNAVSGI